MSAAERRVAEGGLDDGLAVVKGRATAHCDVVDVGVEDGRHLLRLQRAMGGKEAQAGGLKRGASFRPPAPLSLLSPPSPRSPHLHRRDAPRGVEDDDVDARLPPEACDGSTACVAAGRAKDDEAAVARLLPLLLPARDEKRKEAPQELLGEGRGKARLCHQRTQPPWRLPAAPIA